MAGNQPPAVKVASKQRQAKALELRKAGLTYQQIADALGFKGKSGAQKAIESGLAEMVREPAEALVELELLRLDHMLRVAWQLATDTNTAPMVRLHAIDRILRIQERRAKYQGLDKPIQVNVQAMVQQIAAELELDENDAAELLNDAERFLLDQRKAALADGLD